MVVATSASGGEERAVTAGLIFMALVVAACLLFVVSRFVRGKK